MRNTGMNRRTFLNTSAGLSLASAAALAADEAGKDGSGSLPQNRSPVSADLQQTPERPNEKIEQARKIALSHLQPTPKQREHGLDLHRASLVFDAYGFAPRAAVDGDALAQAVDEGASDLEYQDLTEDMGMTRCVTDAVEQAEFLQAWAASGVTCIFQNAGEEGQDIPRLLKRLARFTFICDMLRPILTKAATPEDVAAAKQAGRICLYLTGNGVPLTQQWVSVPDELRYIRVFYQLGIRMMHMTYQRRNMLGDGCGEPANAGLSDFGRAAVAEMNRNGVIPDVAHSGWQTSLETARASKKPVVASHSTCAGLYRHFRGKPDDVLKAIAETGGYIGICCIPRFLGGTGDIRALLDHVDYAVKTIGIDHVAIGTDVAYQSRNAAAESKKVPRRPRKREAFRSLWPVDDFSTTAEMTQSVSWTNWPLFTVGLVQRGYSDDDIQKILGGNVMRVCRESIAE